MKKKIKGNIPCSLRAHFLLQTPKHKSGTWQQQHLLCEHARQFTLGYISPLSVYSLFLFQICVFFVYAFYICFLSVISLIIFPLCHAGEMFAFRTNRGKSNYSQTVYNTEKKNLINNQYISNHTLLNKIILLK